MDVLIGQLATGLSLGSILLLAALGLALTFGQMGVINMAHGEFIMAGCYTAFVVQKFISNAGASLLISLVVGFVVGGLLGVLLEVTLIQRMYDRPLDTLLVTFGVGLILQQVARNLFGAPAVNVTAPSWLSGGVEILGAVVPRTRILILVLAIVCVTINFRGHLDLRHYTGRVDAALANVAIDQISVAGVGDLFLVGLRGRQGAAPCGHREARTAEG